MNCFTFFLFIYLHSCSIFWPYSQFGFTSNRFPWTHSATTSSLANPFWTWADLIRFSNESYWIWLNSWSAERPNGGWRPAERHTSSMKIFFPFFSSFFLLFNQQWTAMESVFVCDWLPTRFPCFHSMLMERPAGQRQRLWWPSAHHYHRHHHHRRHHRRHHYSAEFLGSILRWPASVATIFVDSLVFENWSSTVEKNT